MGPVTPQPRPASAEKPSLHGHLCLWAHPEPQAPRREGAATPVAPRTVAHRDPRRSSRLHLLGQLRREPGLPARQRPGQWCRTAQEPAPGRACPIAGPHRVWALRGAHDRPLLRPARPDGARVPLPEARHRKSRATMPEGARQGHRPRHRRAARSHGDAARPGNGPNSARRAPGPGRPGRRPAPPAGGKGPLRSRARPAPLPERGPRQPPGGPVARS